MKAVVLAVDNSAEFPFLTTLVHRLDTFTTLIWGWQGDGQASPMVGPASLLKEQSHVPFLFSPTDQQEKQVTHFGLSGLIVHTDGLIDPVTASWLVDRRIERFAQDDRHHPLVGTKSVYAITATRLLPKPIPYGDLILVKENRPLSPEKRRGYSTVAFPEHLISEYAAACRNWEELWAALPTNLLQSLSHLKDS